MQYAEAIDYLSSLKLRGMKLGLANVCRVLACLGNPHESLRFLHIAGTNGKGSTAAMAAAILRQCGFRVGLYTSPHLRSCCERLRINGQPVDAAELARLIAALKRLQEAPPAADEATRQAFAHLTFFEFLTVLALQYFQRQAVDWVVWETGLGGRLDATNVVLPEVCLLTPISLDHQHYLGEDLASIAAEKAGIIKPGVPAASAPQVPSVAAVLRRRCGDVGAPFLEVESACARLALEASRRGLRFDLRTPRRTYAQLTLRQAAEPQCDNAALAILACEILEARGVLRLDGETVHEALRNLELPARFQIVAAHPWVIFDGAHNPAAMAALAAALRRHFPGQRLTLVLGIMRDKDLEGILREIVPLAQEVLIAVPRNERSPLPRELSERVAPYGVACREADSVAQALSQALAPARAEDVVCVTGSFYTVGEALAWWEATHAPATSSAAAWPGAADAREMQF